MLNREVESKDPDQKELIRRSSIFFGDKSAVIYRDQALSFKEVNERGNRLANGLANRGIRPGMKVATLAGNCLQYPEIEFGLLKGAFPQLTLNPRLKANELTFQINDAEVDALIFQHSFLEVVNSIHKDLGTVKHLICFGGNGHTHLDYERLLSSSSPMEPDAALPLHHLGELRYTSGTSGTPKGIMLPYLSGLTVTRNLLLDFIPDLTSEDRFLAVQPLYHGAGWFILPVWVKGMTQYVISEYDPKEIFELIEKERITAIKTIPTLILRLLDSPEVTKHDLSSLRTIIYGGEPMPVDRLKEAMRIFGPIFVGIYGQTEAPMTICILRKEDHKKEKCLGSVGRPCTLVHVKAVDPNDEDIPSGELGEIILKGDHQMTGYLKNEQATKETLRNGWVHTGDLGVIDQEGYVHLTGGRRGDMIISGGLNIYPNEVEQVLYENPSIAEAAVIGVPDEEWGEKVKACVVLKKGHRLSEEELINFCKDRIASYKKPRSVDFLDELPKNAQGKILRRELRKRYRENA